MEPIVSGVGVLDKSMQIVSAIAAAGPPGSRLNDLVSDTGLPKPTAHRLAVALERHGFLRRRVDGRYVLGTALIELGRRAARAWPIAEQARPLLAELRRLTGESVQLYVREGDDRVCLVSLESAHELRTIVPEGARLPLTLGSAGRLLRGEAAPDGWVESIEERAPGVASVSAPVVVDGTTIAAVGVSGPVGRLGDEPGRRFGVAVVDCAADIVALVSGGSDLGVRERSS